jgi:hypothetical protein
MGRREPIPHPRRIGPIGRSVVDFLSDQGVRGPVFVKTKHIAVTFEHAGRSITLRFPCTPRDTEVAMRQFRCAFRKAVAA